MRFKTILITFQDMEKFVKGELRTAISNAPSDLRVEAFGASAGGTHLLCSSSEWPDLEGTEVPGEFTLIMKMPGSR